MATKKKTGRKKKWMQEVRQQMEKKGTVGALRRQAAREGALKGGKIDINWLRRKAKQGGVIGKRARLALIFRRYAGKKKGRKKKSS